MKAAGSVVKVSANMFLNSIYDLTRMVGSVAKNG